MSELQGRLASLSDDGAIHVALGTIDSLEAHEAWGRLANVTIQPQGLQIQARLFTVATGDGVGVHVPIADGDEVVVLCPGGLLRNAVAIAGLASKPAPMLDSWNNDRLLVIYPDPSTFATSKTAPVQSVVTEEFLSGMVDVLVEIATGLAIVPAATTKTLEMVTKLQTQFRSKAIKTE